MTIGSKIAQARREQGITQIELADQMCVTRQTISRWETGAALPDIEKVADLAEILQVSCDYLLRKNVSASMLPANKATPFQENVTFVTDRNDLPDDNITSLTDKNIPPQTKNSVTKLLSDIVGKMVCISFYEDEEDMDVWDNVCKVDGFEGNWIRVTIQQKGETHTKLIALSSILSFEIVEQEEN